jgi:hypothetical protein
MGRAVTGETNAEFGAVSDGGEECGHTEGCPGFSSCKNATPTNQKSCTGISGGTTRTDATNVLRRSAAGWDGC